MSAVAVFLWLLPTFLTQVIRYQVPRMGLGQIEIGNIDLNLFRGKLLVEEVSLYRSAARVFSLQRAELNLAMLSLFDERVYLESVAVDGLSVTVIQNAGQSLQIAGIAIPVSADEQSPEVSRKNVSSWLFGADSLTLTDSSIQVLHPQFSETIQFNDIYVGPLAMWRPDYITPFSLNVGLRDGMFAVSSKISPFATEPEHRVEIKVDSLSLDNFSKLTDPVLTEFTGEVSAKMELQLRQSSENRITLYQKGNLSLKDLRLQQGASTLAQQSLHWNGELAMDDIADVDSLQANGNLKFSGIEVMVEGEEGAALSLDGVSVEGLSLQGSRQLAMKELGIKGLVTAVSRTAQGIKLAGLPDNSAVTEEPPVDSDIAPQATTTDSLPFMFRIDKMRLTGDNSLTFNDQTVKPLFSHTLTITEGEFQHIDNSQVEQPVMIMLKGKDDHFATFDVEGESKPFAPQLALNLTAKLNGFDMPPVSPYLAQLLGYRITTGQLDSLVKIQIAKNEMKGEVELRMNQLQLEQEDLARSEEFQSKTALPLNTALSLLRDKEDNIKLNLPISGALDDPKFALDDIINTALGKALKAGSVSYLKHLLQPYSSLITVVQLAGSVTGEVKLDPVRFSAGSAELLPTATDYVGKISQLMAKKSINLKLCGFSSTADLAVITKGKLKDIPAAGHPALEALAKQRAESVKSLLVNGYSIDPKQLFICHPELDSSAEAEPRVELSL